MIRVIAVVAAIIAIVLFVVVAAFNPANPLSIEAWGFVCLAVVLLCFAIEPFVPAAYRRGPAA